jgi:hypothetical protein
MYWLLAVESDRQWQVEMIRIAGVTGLCVAAVGFYLRFLVALCRERRISCRARIQPAAGDEPVTAKGSEKALAARAA